MDNRTIKITFAPSAEKADELPRSGSAYTDEQLSEMCAGMLGMRRIIGDVFEG
jgi:hypothetical protein